MYQKIFEYIQISNYSPHPGAHLSDASPNERLVNTANLSRLPPLLIIHPLSTLETVGKDEKKNCGQCFGVNVRVSGASKGSLPQIHAGGIRALLVRGGGLNPYPDGLGQLFWEEFA